MEFDEIRNLSDIGGIRITCKYIEDVYKVADLLKARKRKGDFSECIKNLMSRPPQTLYEVMQFSALFLYFEEIGCERARTLGDIDRLYLPYYQNDKKNGISQDKLDELFKYFFIHFVPPTNNIHH